MPLGITQTNLNFIPKPLSITGVVERIGAILDTPVKETVSMPGNKKLKCPAPPNQLQNQNDDSDHNQKVDQSASGSNAANTNAKCP